MENRFPQEIIERIQSCMNIKEASRTTILSKSWYRAWSTRPNLDFDQRHFPCRTVYQLLEFAKKTMQRYEDLNLKIHILRLLLVESHDDDVSLAKELMVKAMKLGAVDLDITLWNSSFVLPDEVIQSETLAALSLTGSFQIDLAHLNCSQLKSLSLSVNVKCDLVRDLISRFPLLEMLKFDGHYSLCDDESKRSHPFFDDRMNRFASQLECDFRTLKFEFDNLEYEFRKLEYMYLGHLIVRGHLFADASIFSKFPFLKELVIWDCRGFKDIRICSKSLERISIGLVEERRSYVTEFDVPNIRKFKFEGCVWSRLALKTARTEWESDIRVMCSDASAEWFISLHELLKKLSLSKVFLSIKVMKPVRDCSGSIRLGPHVVENLMLESCVLTSTFMDNLFRICRPKFIIQENCVALGVDTINRYLLKLVCKRVVEKVNVELYQECLPWKLFFLDDRCQFVRFQLRWRPESSAGD